jgi:hypothetical protein
MGDALDFSHLFDLVHPIVSARPLLDLDGDLLARFALLDSLVLQLHGDHLLPEISIAPHDVDGVAHPQLSGQQDGRHPDLPEIVGYLPDLLFRHLPPPFTPDFFKIFLIDIGQLA